MNILRRPVWSPWAVGAGIGVLSWLAFLTAKKPLGVTSPFESAAVALGQKAAPRLTRANRHLARSDDVPALDWESALDVGIVAGSALSALASRDRSRSVAPASSARRHGAQPLTRLATAFVGGAIMMFGARAAKGCTSGHAISGMMQLAASSWVFSPVMAASAVLTARVIHREGGRRAR